MMTDLDSSPDYTYPPDHIPQDAYAPPADLPAPYAITGQSPPNTIDAYTPPPVSFDLATEPSPLIGEKIDIDATYIGNAAVDVAPAVDDTPHEAEHIEPPASGDEPALEPVVAASDEPHSTGSGQEASEPLSEGPQDAPAPPPAGGTPPVPPEEPRAPAAGSPDDEGPGEEPKPEIIRIGLIPLRHIRTHDIANAKNEAARYAKSERDAAAGYRAHWYVSDSALERGSDSFAEWFENVLPAPGGLKNYIETTLEPLSPRIGIELGGPGSQLFSNFSPGFFDATIGVNLIDPRTEIGKMADEWNRHKIIPGDMLTPETVQRIDNELGGRQVSLVIERVFAGMHSLPKDPFTLAANANLWYERLTTGGLMLAQVPTGLDNLLERWKEMAEAEAPGLDIQTGQHKTYSLVRIHKRPGSPPSLPLISARTLMEERNAGRTFRIMPRRDTPNT